MARFFFVHFVFFFSFITLVKAGEFTKVEWNEGEVFLTNGKVKISFPDQTEAEFTNLIAGPESKESDEIFYLYHVYTVEEKVAEEEKTTSTQKTKRPIKKKTEKLVFKDFEKPALNTAIEGMKVVRYEISEKNTLFMWFSASHENSGKLGGKEFSVYFVDTLKTRGKYEVTHISHYNLRSDAFPNQLGLIPLGQSEKDNLGFDLFIYDRAFNLIEIFNVPVKLTNGFYKSTNVTQVRSIHLPAELHGKKSLDDEYPLYWNNVNRNGKLILKKSDPMLIGTPEEQGDPETEDDKEYKQSNIEQKKARSRAPWIFGLENIQKQLLVQNLESLGIENIISKWDIPTELAGAISQLADQDEDREEKTLPMISITVSPEVLSYDPKLRGKIFRSLLDAGGPFGTIKDDARNIIYVKMPKVYSEEIVSSLTATLRDQLSHHSSSNTVQETHTVFIDALDTLGLWGDLHLHNFFSFIQQLMVGANMPKFQFVFLAPWHLYNTFKEPSYDDSIYFYSERIALDKNISIDQFVPESAKMAVLSKIVKNRAGQNISVTLLTDIYQKILRDHSGSGSVVSNLGKFGRTITQILKRSNLQFDDPQIVEKISYLFKQMSGERKVGPFEPEIIQRAKSASTLLSKNFPNHHEKALLGRDPIIREIATKTMNWLVYGHRNRPLLPFLFLGDTGTGKTMLAEGLADVLGGVTETLNVSKGSKKQKPPSSRYRHHENDEERQQQEAEEALIEELHAKVDKLVFDPNPVKILILDEIHTSRKIFNYLLPALGDNDRKTNDGLNLDGIILVMIANVDKDCDAYHRLSDENDIESEQYPTQLVDLLKASVSNDSKGKNQDPGSSSDSKVIGAFAGRILSNIYFFPPIKTLNIEEEKMDLVEESIADFEQRNNMRIIWEQEAIDFLRTKAKRFQEGNFRAVKRFLDDELSAAISEYLSKDPEFKLDEQTFILSVAENGKQKQGLKFMFLGEEKEAITTLVTDTYDRLSNKMSRSIDFALNSLKLEAEVDDADFRKKQLRTILIQSYRRSLSAYNAAIQNPLFTKSNKKGTQDFEVKNIIPEIRYPKEFSFNEQVEISKYFKDLLQTWFDKYTNKKGTTHTTSHSLKEEFSELGQVAQKIFAGLNEIRARSKSDGSENKIDPFQQWIIDVNKVSLGTSGEERRAGSSLEVATGYFIDHLLRELSREKYKEILKTYTDEFGNMKRSVKKPLPIAISSKSIGECEQSLLEAGNDASERIQNILKNRE